tara:strand:- start:44 stop:265 length:222 start_codon:yes stop_codon:yes gene_type:complete
MKRRRKGGLIQKQHLTNNLQEYRVISIEEATGGISMIGVYSSFDEALIIAKENKKPGHNLYIHGDSNRIIAEV